MPDRQPLDLRIEIGGLFDRGTLVAPVALGGLAARVALQRYSVKRAISVLGLHHHRKAYQENGRHTGANRPAPYVRRGQVSRSLFGCNCPSTQDVLELFESGRMTGRCSAEDIAQMVDVSAERARRCLKALGFKVVKRQTKKHVGWKSEVVAPPYGWPDLFQRQRELHREGVSAGAVFRATDAAAGVDGVGCSKPCRGFMVQIFR